MRGAALAVPGRHPVLGFVVHLAPPLVLLRAAVPPPVPVHEDVVLGVACNPMRAQPDQPCQRLFRCRCTKTSCLASPANHASRSNVSRASAYLTDKPRPPRMLQVTLSTTSLCVLPRLVFLKMGASRGRHEYFWRIIVRRAMGKAGWMAEAAGGSGARRSGRWAAARASWRARLCSCGTWR